MEGGGCKCGQAKGRSRQAAMMSRKGSDLVNGMLITFRKKDGPTGPAVGKA